MSTLHNGYIRFRVNHRLCFGIIVLPTPLEEVTCGSYQNSAMWWGPAETAHSSPGTRGFVSQGALGQLVAEAHSLGRVLIIKSGLASLLMGTVGFPELPPVGGQIPIVDSLVVLLG